MTQSAIVRWSSPEVILVATNLLEGQTLLLHAIYQARLSRAKVLLVHVIPPSYLRTDALDGAPSPLPGHAVRVTKMKLDEMAKEFQFEGVLCEPILLTGLPAEQISLLVKARRVDRVIVATRYASGVARLIEGSVAEDLVATLDIPVCIIGRRARPGPACGTPLGHVLLATSFGPESSLLASFASALAEVNQAHLTLLHVLDTEGMSEQDRQMARFFARERLCALVPNEARHRDHPVFLIREGTLATVILEEAGSVAQDMVILGSPKSSMASRLIDDGGVVHRLVVESQCPVITVRFGNTSSLEEIHESTSTEAMSIHP